jgi:hypothetical protein
MPVSAEVALVRVTVHAMEQLASALKAKPVPLEPQERADNRRRPDIFVPLESST